jgi:glycopeptide antibiotics resistance protein
VGAVLALAVVLWFTLREDRYVAFANLTGSNLVPLRHHLAALDCWLDDCEAAEVAADYLLVDVLGNIALFVPLGLCFAALSTRASRMGRFVAAVLPAAVLSLAIELTQLAMPSRASDVDDVLFNTVGAMLGGLVGVLVVAAPRARRRRRG